MIDDNWAQDYGTWHFDLARFPDPRGMLDQLHAWGFTVMLWLVPFVSPDSATFRALEHAGLLIRDAAGEPVVRRWWNGFSASLDLTNPEAVAWLTRELDALTSEIGVDGFKFDAGDLQFYALDDANLGSGEPVDLCEAWARLGLRYPFNEYRACWKMGGQPLAQRLHDKPPSWGAEGLASLVPELVAQGLIGHAFTCPDMIGGGLLGAVSEAEQVDQELYVRYAQISALAPMMQFSLLPDRVLDKTHLDAVRKALDIRQELLPLILDLVEHASQTGEPVVRAMAYHARGMEAVSDQFFLGPDLLIAPVVRRGERHRTVVLPDGTWLADDGAAYQGPARVDVPVDLDRVPRLQRTISIS
jgi:alpha-glucosidase (family GH31 glycosyl hydrolase)